jgi:RNA polymerase sigma-70 factor (ECF subfamily)
MLKDNERQQIEDAKADPQCFEPLYLKYYEPILRFVYKRIEHLDDVREVTSVIFTKALMNIQNYKDMGFPFSSWLYRIAINEINQFYRDSTRTRIIDMDEKGIGNMAEETGNPKDEMIGILQKALRHLSADDLMLLELRYFESYTFSEIGQLLNLTEVNAKIKTYRILEKLKTIYIRIS